MIENKVLVSHEQMKRLKKIAKELGYDKISSVIERLLNDYEANFPI